MKRALALVCGLLIGFTPAMFAATGGYPSRPQFQSAAVGAPPQPNKSIFINGEPTRTTIPPGLTSQDGQLITVTHGFNSQVAARYGTFAQTLNYAIAGTPAAPLALPNGYTIGFFDNTGYDGTSIGDAAGWGAVTTEAWSPGNHGSSQTLLVCGNGTTNCISQITIASNLHTFGNVTTNPNFTFIGTGTLSVPNGNVTVGGLSVCRSDGTNCPAATGVGANFIGVMTGTDSRTSTVAPTCATGMTVTLPNVTARYQFTAFLRFTGGGITANGWRANIATTGGTHVTRFIGTATANTSAANVAPTANGSSISGDFTALFAAAGVDAFVTLTGTDSVTSPASPTLCLAFAQNTSNGTATTLQDSSIVVTRLN